MSFYVGLLLPTCCIANTRSVEQVIYYTTFKGMEDSFQVDWLSRTFNTIKLDKEISYSISAFYEESLKNEEKTIQKIETYLYNSHDQSFRYRIYSPEIELRNNTIKVMTSLQAINKVALLFMAVFLTGMIAIYQLRFEHREESYGISLAYGAQYKELYWEIFCEILLLNSIGTIIGIVIGYLVTYYVDFGIMISVVNVQGSWYTFLSAYGLCVVLSSFVSVITFRKLKKKKIIELLNVY